MRGGDQYKVGPGPAALHPGRRPADPLRMGLLRALVAVCILVAGAVVAGAIRPDLPVAGTLARVLRPPDPSPAATPAVAQPTEDAARASAGPIAQPAPADDAAAAETTRAESVAAPSGTVLYRFVDEAGVLRIVDSLDDVPPAHRAKARRLETSPDRSAFETTLSSPPAPPRPRPQVVAEEPVRPRYDEVVLYVTSWCPYCKRAAADLNARGIDFVMRDIDDDDDARAELREKIGSTQVPVLDVDGRIVPGYSPATYARLFGGR